MSRAEQSGPTPFDQENPGERGEFASGDDHVLKHGEVHFTDHSRPNRAPDTTAARARHSHGKLRKTLDRIAPSGSKRRTVIAGGAVAGAALGGTAGGGAEWAGRQAESVMHTATSATPESTATQAYGDAGVSQEQVERSVEQNQLEQVEGQAAAAESGPEATNGVTSSVELDSPTPEDQTVVIPPEETANAETGGIPPGTEPGSGGGPS